MNTSLYHVVKGSGQISIEQNEFSLIQRSCNFPDFQKSAKKVGFMDNIVGPHHRRFENIDRTPAVNSKYRRHVCHGFDKVTARDLSKTLFPNKPFLVDYDPTVAKEKSMTGLRYGSIDMDKQINKRGLFKASIDSNICSIDSMKITTALSGKIGGKKKTLNYARIDR
jgi:hypothetical protein